MSSVLIAGLGNPGKAYENTRHNVGFMVIDLLADRLGISVSKSKYKCTFDKGRWRGHELILAKPMDFMNRSGGPIQQLARFYQVDPEGILVISDDIELPFGKLRIRAQGGHGGHNGLRSLIATLGTNAFPRIRLGISRPDHPGKDVADHVLGRFTAAEEAELNQMIETAAEAALTIVDKGINIGMNNFN